MKKHFYITTPIYYPSAKLHIGHVYCTTIADAIARFKRLTGHEVFFLTGSDEHGQKIQRLAQLQQKTPIEYVDPIVNEFKSLWKKFNISNDDFIRTTELRHIETVQEIFRKIKSNGDIYKGKYTGLYCTPCESYWTKTQLDENGCCPDCHRSVEKVSEEAYFFKLSKYADKILKHIEKHPEFIVPNSRRNEMINFIQQGLEDLCISRTSFDWGIPIPNDEQHVIYVWFDAVLNYLTPLIKNSTRMEKFWPADIHLIGKEIVRFHAIIWPCILMAAGFQLPKQIYGHGWLISGGDKMSKSKENVIDPTLLVKEFGADAIRYFLLREIVLGNDGSFTREALIQRINSDLANDLGNLLQRTLRMIDKFQRKILLTPTEGNENDKKFRQYALDTTKKYERLMENTQLSDAVKTIWNFINCANKYIDETMPWRLARDKTQEQNLANVLYNLAESLRIISILISPFMPNTSQKINSQLKIPQKFETLQLADAKIFGKLENNHMVGNSEQLFPRIEIKK